MHCRWRLSRQIHFRFEFGDKRARRLAFPWGAAIASACAGTKQMRVSPPRASSASRVIRGLNQPRILLANIKTALTLVSHRTVVGNYGAAFLIASRRLTKA